MVAGPLLLLTACGDDPSPGVIPTAAPSIPATTPTPDDSLPTPSASWSSRITKGDSTFWMTIGGLPSQVTDVTRPSRTQHLTFRLECDRGRVVAKVELDGAPRIWDHPCADGRLTSDLGTIQKGTEVRISMTGTEGTQYVADMRRPQ
ncbi:hypothetical protein GCM10010123_12570 [Pilimelia anulata]|uniref:Uncharacterized protein n=1 Tax=Pilimelia anulata TaxID=53371 RepID=A0A8J3B8D9_9ACTN|nr:hypothetical protein GCM10010123_12570 [Pilimelia anulata]